MKRSIWIGFDEREPAEFAVARESVRKHSLPTWQIRGLVLSALQKSGLYTRPMEIKQGVDGPEMWDVISGARQSTQHANSRFLVPHLAKEGWAMFMDGDTKVRENLAPLFSSLDYSKALYCVHHKYEPEAGTKMDGQVQQKYNRKNWSSVVIFNCDHPANEKLTVEVVNTLPGRDLHRFCWLEDRHIGELDAGWNFLVGHTDPSIEPKILHWTSGTPAMRGHENVPFAEEWRRARDEWAQGSMSLPG